MSTDAMDRLKAALSGRYRIERELGEGGMATVYLADDVKHERKVALKVLKPELAAVVGAERFLAEIKTTANLQHPHILPLFDSGEADGFVFYVMPHVEGESVRQKLDREHQLPVDEAVRIASNVAEALDYAHRQGVIHRDIKPANILLQDGKPVISDFGIALAVGSAGEGRLTETGLSLGTPHYMSPEQATGDQTVGPATDTYALGCVLYEMLVGEPPFTGSTAQAILGKIIAGSPEPVTAQRKSVPANVAAAIAKALEKLPADRFESGRQLAGSLADASFRWPAVSPAAGHGRWKAAFVAASAVAVVATVLAIRPGQGPGPPSEPRPTTALSFLLPEDQLLDGQSDPTLALSPDGTTLVYVAEEGRGRRLYVRESGDFDVRPLEGTEGGRAPFFSPDGQWVGYFADGVLSKVAIDGGIPSRIADVPGQARGASWGDDGTIIYSLSGSSLWRVPDSGGSPAEIPLVLDTADALSRDVPLPTSLVPTRWPDFLPGEDLALVTTSFSPTTMGVIDLTTGRFRPIGGGDRPRYLASGHIVFYAGRENVSVVPFSLERLEITGPAVPIVDDALRPAGSEARFAVANSGTLAYALGGFDRQLMIVDRNGRETPLEVELRGYRMPAVSRDGSYLAVTIDPQPPQIWVIDLRRQSAQPVTTDGYNLAPGWSPDGKRLAFTRMPSIVWVPWPGGGEATVIREGGGHVWVRENQLFVQVEAGDLALVDVETGTATDWLATSAFERQPAVSPDGDWVSYTSNVTGVDEVYVRAYAGDDTPRPISRGGGAESRWSRDGTEIYYRDGNSIMAVAVRTTPTFAVTASPALLFSEAYDFSTGRNWDVLPDGRFIMVRSNPNIGHEVRFLIDWFGELGQRIGN